MLAMMQLLTGDALPPELASARLFSHFVMAQEYLKAPVYNASMALFLTRRF